MNPFNNLTDRTPGVTTPFHTTRSARMARAASAALAGATGGPRAADNQALLRDYERSHYVTFRGGEYAQVEADEVDGDDIDIKVYDEDGDLVARDTDPDGHPVCRWWVSRTQRYRIKVINASDGAVLYDFETN